MYYAGSNFCRIQTKSYLKNKIPSCFAVVGEELKGVGFLSFF